jgi:2-polyprenyl-3-methyl-5-hydroxy-6-metoxy-1,4-benzoquinol methylase
MATVQAHYQDHLAPIYTWMVGGTQAAFEAGAAELESLALPAHARQAAVDLGAGFGMHALPWARRGGRVLAIDSSPELLNELARHAAGLPVQRVQDDLLAFPSHLTEVPEVVLCMGDTITHLADLARVEQLVRCVAAVLAAGGTFVVSWRDYSVPLHGEQRFVPVRSDGQRILTCFLEYEDDTVIVHDVLHEKEGPAWRMAVSSYRKLRLSPEALGTLARSAGFTVQHQAGLRGMVRLVCTKAGSVKSP